MRKRLTKSALSVLLAVCMAAALLAGCGNITNEETQEGGKATALEIVGPSRAMADGEQLTLLWDFLPAGSAHERIVWQVSDKGVADVGDNGSITARRPGTCTVTGTTESGLSGSVEITVVPLELTLNEPDSINMKVGETYKLNVSTKPENAQIRMNWHLDDTEYSSNNVISVSGDGVITAKREGKTEVTGIDIRAGQQVKTIQVNVLSERSDFIGFDNHVISSGTALEFRYPADGSLNFFIVSPYAEEEAHLQTGSGVEEGYQVVQFTFPHPGWYWGELRIDGNSDDEPLAEVNILVTDATLPETLHLETGEAVSLIQPDQLTMGEKHYMYLRTDDPSIAGPNLERDFLNGADGKVYARAPGTATITLKGNGEIIATCKVTVTGGEPTVSAALESVTAASAAVGVTASEHCTLNAFLCAGTPAAPEGYTVPGALQKKQLSNSAGGSFSFGGLTPDSDYTVFYYGVNSAGMSSQLRRVNFTTAKPAVATLSISLEARLEAVTDLSASVSIKASAPCGFTAYLYPGGAELPAASGGVRPGSLQKRTFSNVAEGAVTFAGLEPDTAYTVYVDSTGILGISGSTKRLDFTTELLYSKPVEVSGWIEVNAHVPVTNITGIPTKLTVGRTVTLNPTVIPSNATKRTVVWSIADDPSGSVTLEGSRLTGAAPTGEKPVTLRATIAGGGESGGSFTKDFAITVVSSGAPDPDPEPEPKPEPEPDPETDPGPGPEPAALVLIEPSGLSVSGSNALPGGAVNTAYSLDFEAAGGKGKPYAIALQTGSLPKGLALTAASDTTAKLSGTLSEAGRYPFTLRVTDSGGGFTDYAFTLEVAEAEPDFVPVTGISGLPTYMIQGKTIKLSGTVAPSNATKQDIIWESRDGAGHYYTLSGNTLKAALDASGTANLRARIKGGGEGGKDYTQDFEVAINYQVVIDSPLGPALTPATVGEFYSIDFHAMNGCGEGYVFTVVNGELPAGLALKKEEDDTATLSGTPTDAGDYEFKIRVADRDGNFGDFPFALEVAGQSGTN